MLHMRASFEICSKRSVVAVLAPVTLPTAPSVGTATNATGGRTASEAPSVTVNRDLAEARDSGAFGLVVSRRQAVLRRHRPAGRRHPAVRSEASEPKVSAAQSSSAVTTTGGSTVSVSQAAKVIETSEPQTLVAPKDDVELARNAKPVEVKPDPAPKQDVDAL